MGDVSNCTLYTFTNLSTGAYTVALQAAQFQAGGALADWYPTTPASGLITTSLAAGQAITTADFGLNIPTSYTLTKAVNTAPPIRIGEPISYTIRVTNTGKTTLTSLPMSDIYNIAYLSYGYTGRFSSPPSQDNLDDGQIDWPDLVVSFGQTLAPNAGFSVVVTFTAVGDTNALPDKTISNTVEIHDAIAEAMGVGVPTPPRIRLPTTQDAAPVKIDNPTGLDVTGIQLTRQDGGGAALAWTTANESQILGFNIVREADRGRRQVVTPEIIAAEMAGAAQGTTYHYVDRGLPAGRYTYMLEIVRLDGRVEPRPAGQITIP